MVIDPEIPNWMALILTGLGTAVIAFFTALVTRTPALHNVINNSLRTLLQEQDKKIAELTLMVDRIQQELDKERQRRLHYESLLRIRVEICGPCDKWAVALNDLLETEKIAVAHGFGTA